MVFFVTADVESGQSYGEVLGSYGLDADQQLAALQLRRNAHLTRGLRPGQIDRMLGTRPVGVRRIVVPIDLRLAVPRFEPVIDLADGLRPRPVGASGAPTLTHGVTIHVARNRGAGTNLKWIQTVRKENNPDSSQPVEFVDVGINGEPFFSGRGLGPVVFTDTPCGPIAPSAGAGIDFTAMTTLAVLARRHIILATGQVWGYVINDVSTLPDGVTPRPPRDATDADFRNQRRILRAGINQFREPTGPDLDYRLPPAAGSVVT